MKNTAKASSATVSTRKVNPKKPALFSTWADTKNSLLIVSLLANLFVLCLWITLNITSHYDSALYSFFITR